MTKVADCTQCGEHDWVGFTKMVSVVGQEGHIPEMIVQAKCNCCTHEQVIIGPCPDPVAANAIAEYEALTE